MALRIFRLEPDPEPEPMETGNFLIEISSKGPVKTTETEDGSITIFHYSPTETEVVHFRRHQNAYAAFVIYAGRFQFWNNHLGYNLRVGDFVFVPPESIYGYKPLEPQSQFLILTTGHNPARLFHSLRYDPSGELWPSPSIQRAGISYDIHFEQNYSAPAIHKGLLDIESGIPMTLQPYFLRIMNSNSWILGGVLSRPCTTALQSEGRFSISSLETSWILREKPFVSRWLCFTRVTHCFCIIEGVFKIKFKDDVEWKVMREGQVIVVPERQEFTADVGSEFLRVIVFTNGAGIDDIIQKAGSKCEGAILPEVAIRWDNWDELRFQSACVEVGALLT